MTREELKELIKESVRENLFSDDIFAENAEEESVEESAEDETIEEVSESVEDDFDEDMACLEQCELIEETFFNKYVDSYILTEDYINLEPELLTEAKKAFYNNANNSRELRDKKHQLLQGALAKKAKVKETMSKVTQAVKAAAAKKKGEGLTKADLKAIAKQADVNSVLSDSQLNAAIGAANVAGLIGKADTAEADKVIDAAEKAMVGVRNSKAKMADDVVEVLKPDTILNADGSEVKEKTAQKIASQLGSGFKAVGDRVVSIYSGKEGNAKRAAAIALTATAMVGSVAAAARVRAKKKAKEAENNKKK